MGLYISKDKFLYFISAAILVTSRFFGSNTNNSTMKYIIAGIWCLYFFMCCFQGSGTLAIESSIYKHLKLILINYVVIFAYTCLIWLFAENVTFSNFTRMCSTILYILLYVGFACSGYLLFRKEALDIILWASAASYGIGSFGYMLVTMGPASLLQYFRALFTGADSSSAISYAMEVHGLTFMAGVLFLYYCFFEDKKTRHHILKIVISALLVVMGLKRIEILAIIVAISAYLLTLRGGRSVRFRSILFTILIIAVTSVFIYSIDSGLLSSFTEAYSIDTSGRLQSYNYSKSYFEMSPTFTGLGFTYFSRLYQQLYYSGFRIDGHGVAASVHSDILQMFIELGFVMFYCWIIYNFYYRTNYLNKWSSYKVAECYLLVSLYMFILYLTDNTMTYNAVQMAYFLVPLVLEDDVENNLEEYTDNLII